MDLKEENILGDNISDHWYYQSKASALQKFINKKSELKILDVGAGSGFFSKFLLKNLPRSEAVCVDINYEKETEQLISGSPIKFVKSIENTNADVVLLMDVLEHVDNDVGLLKEYVNKSGSGTRFIITVPAFNFLWSSHDVFLEHKRRYTIASLNKTLVDSGLKIDQSCYFFGVIFPVAFTVRMLGKFKSQTDAQSDLSPAKPWLNSILKSLLYFETKLFKHNKIFGLSVFGSATKR